MPKDVGQESVSHRGKTYTFPVREIPVPDLRLDRRNPRFDYEEVLRGKALSEKEMEDEIWDDQRTKDLYNSIKTHGGLKEPIWVRHDNVVLEGNRRTVVLRRLKARADSGELREEGITPGAFDTARCVVVPKVTPDEVVRAQMGVWHIGQRKNWKAIAEAKFIFEETEKGRTLGDVAADLTRSAPYLLQKRWAYERMADFAKLHPGKVVEEHFSYFEELYKARSSLSEPGLEISLIERTDDGSATRYRAVPAGMGKLYSWILAKKFGSEGARGLRALGEIFTNAEATKVFLEKDLKSAETLLNAKEPSRSDPVFAALGDALQVVRDLNSDGVLYKPGSRRYSVLKELSTEVGKLLKVSARVEGE